MVINPQDRGARLLAFVRLTAACALVTLLMACAGCSKKSVETPAPRESSSAAEFTSPWRIDLKVEPAHPRMVRPATFVVHIADSNGKPIEQVQVSGSLNMTLMDMGATEIKFAPKGNGNYEATVKSFDMSGPWELRVEALRGDIRAGKKFQVNIFD